MTMHAFFYWSGVGFWLVFAACMLCVFVRAVRSPKFDDRQFDPNEDIPHLFNP